MKNAFIIILLAAVAFAGTTVDLWPILNGRGGTGAFILRDTVWTNNAAGTYTKKGTTDTSGVVYLKGSTMFHTYQWRMAQGTDAAIVDSMQYSEGILCSSAVIGGWVPGANVLSNTNNIRVDSTVNCTYGPNGYGSYEAYFSRCDAIRFILRANAGTHDTDTVKVVSRGLKVE